MEEKDTDVQRKVLERLYHTSINLELLGTITRWHFSDEKQNKILIDILKHQNKITMQLKQLLENIEIKGVNK